MSLEFKICIICFIILSFVIVKLVKDCSKMKHALLLDEIRLDSHSNVIQTFTSRLQKVAKFEKVSLDQYIESFRKLGVDSTVLSDQKIEEAWKNIKLPTRASSGSAGYDFYLPMALYLAPGCSVVIPTGIRCRIDNGFCLKVLPKSGLGFKYRVSIGNTVGLIDSDYYYSDNEGHIMVKMVNDGYLPTHREFHYEKFSDYELTIIKNRVTSTQLDLIPMKLKTGDKFCQGMFESYFITVDDENDEKIVRNGGLGSTGR